MLRDKEKASYRYSSSCSCCRRRCCCSSSEYYYYCYIISRGQSPFAPSPRAAPDLPPLRLLCDPLTLPSGLGNSRGGSRQSPGRHVAPPFPWRGNDEPNPANRWPKEAETAAAARTLGEGFVAGGDAADGLSRPEKRKARRCSCCRASGTKRTQPARPPLL